MQVALSLLRTERTKLAEDLRALKVERGTTRDRVKELAERIDKKQLQLTEVDRAIEQLGGTGET